jgi:hypothetical protein
METIKEVDIRHFKLTSGEDIICYVQSSNDKSFIVERPAAVRISLSGVYTFVDWFPFSDSKVFKIMKRFVINHTPVITETKESYVRYSLQDDSKEFPAFDDLEYEAEEYELKEDIFPTDESSTTIH